MEIKVICYKNPPQKSSKQDGVEGTLVQADLSLGIGLVILQSGDFALRHLSLIELKPIPTVIKK